MEKEMSGYQFIDEKGTFVFEQPENSSYLYFPIAGEAGIKGSVTPNFGGDLKTDQNHFILQPVSAEELHNNKSTRNFWCCLEQGECWSVTGASAQAQAEKYTNEQEKSTLTAGLMWQEVQREMRKGEQKLDASVTIFVPTEGENVEVMCVKIQNCGEEPISLTPIAAVPLYGRGADHIRDHRHVTSLLNRIETTTYGVEVTPTLAFDERGHQKNNTTYYVYGVTGTGETPESFYPVLEEFVGEGGSLERPEAVVKNQQGVGVGTKVEGMEAMGGLRFHKITLRPKESAYYTILIGLTERRSSLAETAAQFRTVNDVERAFQKTKEYWHTRNNVCYHTADVHFDQFMYWVNFQPMLRRIYGCSFLPHHDYGKGGRGWRDLWQDCLALLIMEPDGVREMLLNHFAGVRMDGSNATIIGEHLGEFVADRNNITRVWMDHGFWPLLTMQLYINQTGDWKILLENQHYFKDRQICRGTLIDKLWNVEDGKRQKNPSGDIIEGSILEHLLVQNLTAFYETGEHNSFRLRDADWNDALDMANQNGESVAFTAAYSGNLKTLSFLLRYLQKKGVNTVKIAEEMTILFTQNIRIYEDTEKKEKILKRYMNSCSHFVSGKKLEMSCEKLANVLDVMADWLQSYIRETELIRDEKGHHWFNSYYDDQGRRVEGTFPNGVRMMLTGQVFTIMSGTATKEQIEEIIVAADEYLYCKEMGGYRLNTDFKEQKSDLGRMFGFGYGHKENGAVFSHMAVMYGNALYQRGFVKEGYRVLHSLYEQAMDFEHSRIYPGIPEYFNAKGRGMYHYLTGAASWLMLTVVQQMFGIQGDMGDLRLEPKLLAEQFDMQGKAEITLEFAGRRLHFIYENTLNLEYGKYTIHEVFLDGERENMVISRKKIIALEPDKIHEINIVLK